MMTSNNNIEVSVICAAYNHEKFIDECIRSVLMQKDVSLEILIHDDASTDKTAEIIREYEKKYPEIIKPIYQKENQFLKSISISKRYQYPRVTGKYIAFCEGDDYWTDPQKLQKQYDALENHPEIDICAHASTTISASNGEVLRKSVRLQQSGIIPTEAVIKGGGGFVASASLFFRRSLIEDIPPFRKQYNLDYFLQIHGALHGGMYYFSDNMCVYRSGVPYSSTQRLKKNIAFKISNGKLVYKALKQLDIDTNREYHKTIQKCLLKNRIRQFAYHIYGVKQRFL